MKKKILGIGLQGLVGSRIVELLNEKYDFENWDRTHGFDITDMSQVLSIIRKSNAELVLHLAAKTDVDGCENDKHLGKNGDAWKVNVEGVRNVAVACEETGKKIVYFSTDFVFDGKKTEGEKYTEEDIPNPVNWYGRTKLEGEEIIKRATADYLILRIAYPYRAFFIKKDFVRAIYERLKKNEQVLAITDHFFTPTFIDDIASAVDFLIANNAKGLFHVVGSHYLTPYQAALYICQKFDFSLSLITEITREKFFNNRAPRPFNLSMDNAKIQQLGIKMKFFGEGLDVVKSQLVF